MKKQILFSIVFAMLLIGCKKEIPAPGTPTTTTPVVEESKPETPKKECYAYDGNGSLVEMQIQYNPDNVSGTLNYAIAEKDSNMGTFKGKLENDVILAEYTFQSEGTESTRQVAFKFIDGKLVEGYGDMKGDGTNFKDVTQLKFTSTMPLSKIDCSK